jgi:hypothetical protein
MSHSRPLTPSQPVAVSRRPNLRPAALAALACATVLAAGCNGNPRTESQRYVASENPFAGMLQNPFRRPTEAGFMNLVRHYCASFSVGDSTVGALLSKDADFRTLTSKLYGGDISNDEYINRVLAAYPADDANVPATGCIVDQLQSCFSGRCEVVAADTQPSVPENPQQLEPGIDETPVPAAQREQVDEMIDEADRERAETPTPLP